MEEGYALRFPMETSLFITLAEFITLERACCPFFHFRLEVAPEAEVAWLSLTGGEGVKPLLEHELGLEESY